jgi:glycosyltransferase involved in cell wall biosynthesis
MPLISAIIPAYNYGLYLRQAINSVLEQNVRDLEVIVVDDGSTDSTCEIVEAITDKRVRYHFQENSGLASARNAGILLSSGKYLSFLDADDIWLSQKSALQIRVFEENPRTGLVYGSYQLIDSIGNILATRNAQRFDTGWLEKLVLGNFVAGSASTSMIKQEVFRETGLFDSHLVAGEDWDMWLRIANTYEIRGVKEVVSCIRIHDKNLSSRIRTMDKGYQAVLDKFFNQPDLPISIRKLQKKARARAKISAGVLAAKRGNYRLSSTLSLEALHFHLLLIDAYYLFFRSALRLGI